MRCRRTGLVQTCARESSPRAGAVLCRTAHGLSFLSCLPDHCWFGSHDISWNPDGVDLPGCVPEYLKESPPYLDKTLPGDVGFDPLCLVALANPKDPSAVIQGPWSATARQTKFVAMSPEDQQSAVAWMREAEVKHARLAMVRRSLPIRSQA